MRSQTVKAPAAARQGNFYQEIGNLKSNVLHLGQEWPQVQPSTLARFKAALSFVDDEQFALAANQPIVTVPGPQGFERISDFHRMT